MKKQYIPIGILFVGIIVASIVGIEYFSSRPPAGEAGQPAAVSSQLSASKSQQDKEEVMNKKQYSEAPKMALDASKIYTAVLTTSKGEMKVTLNAKEAPVTVNNFVFLAREEFYNDTVFHRIIKGFMIQGGGPQGTGMGGPGYKFADEPITGDYKRGTIAMANNGPNTNGSQFFIMHADAALPKNYVIFGQIDPSDEESLKTLDALAETPVEDSGFGEMSKPLERVVLSSVTIVE